MLAALVIPVASADARPAVESGLPACTVIGTVGVETLVGTPGDDVICGIAGNDRIRALAGDDVVFGSTGDDVLDGGPGRDRLYGFGGNDRLRGGPGDDLLQGGADADVMSGGPGTDSADYASRRGALRVTIGRGANDGLAGEHDDVGGDVEGVRAGSGDDVLIGNGGRNRLHGGGGDDMLRGGGGNDRLWGDAGDDVLNARDSSKDVDWLRCGAGSGDVAEANARDHVAGSCERGNAPSVGGGGPENHAPTAITLSPATVAENLPTGSTVGALGVSDPDRGQDHTFALVPGQGSDDNGSFRIEGSTLKTAAVFDHEAKSTYSIRVRARDDGRPVRTLNRVLTVQVSDVNEAPTALTLSNASVAENQPVGTAVGTLAASDPDAGETFTYSLASGGDNAAFSIAGSSLRTATPLDYETKRSYAIHVRATDHGGQAVERDFTIAVTDTQDPPVADAKIVTGVIEDGSKTIGLSGSDPEGSPVTFRVVTTPDHGSLDTAGPPATCLAGGCTASVDYTPAGDFNGTDSFTYVVNDGTADSAPVAVAITVDPVNDAPQADPGTGSTTEDTPVDIDLAQFVSDVETSDPNLDYTIVSGPAHGGLSSHGSTLTYSPGGNYSGPDSLTYKVTDRGDPDGCASAPCDAALTSTTETVSITVDPSNDAPVATTGNRTSSEDTPLTLNLASLVSDVETSDANLTYEIVGQPAHGTATSTTYTPDANFNGSDSLTYKVTDRGDPDNCAAAPCDAAKSATGTVSITVDPVNDAPVANPGTRTTNEDTPLTLNLGALVSDVETSDANLTYTIVSQPAHGTATGTTYTPESNYNGPDSLTYKVTDRGDPDNCAAAPCDSPKSSTTETVSITVDPVNDVPTADAKTVSLDEDSLKAITLSGSDVDGNPLTFSIASGPAHGTLTGSGASRTYTPGPNYNGPDSFTYTVNDGTADSAPATVSITVVPVNDIPDASPASLTATEDTALPIGLADLVDDVETSDGNLVYDIVSTPAHGGLTGSGGSRTYTPDVNFNGADSFTYRVIDRGDPDDCTSAPCDAPETSATKTVSITVDPVNDAPSATPTSLTTDEDAPLPVDLGALVSDVETSNANLTYAIVTPPANGTLTGAGGSLTYTPAGDYNGADSFEYQVLDRGDPDNCSAAPCDAPKTSSTETVSLTVNAVNDAPVNTLPAGPLNATQDTDTPIAGVSIADVDAGDDAVQLTLAVQHGVLNVSTTTLGSGVTGNGSPTVVITAPLSDINATLGALNGLVYHGASSYTGPDTLTVTTDDQGHNGAGGAKTDTDTLAISVNPPNVAPVAADQSVPTNEDTAKVITLSAKDDDGDDPLTFAKGTGPTHGSLGPIGSVICDHAAPNTCSANVTYTPDPDFFGSDSFTFTANDGTVDSAPATVSITVNAVNDDPVLAGTEAGALAYTENDPATIVTPATTVADVDSANLDTGTLTVDYAGASGTVDDRLEIRNQGTGAGQIGVSGSDVTFGGTTIGTSTGGSGTTPLVVTLNSSATPAAAQALIRNVTYRNVSDAPATAPRTVRFVLTDGDGGTSNAATRAVTVTAVNDPPALAGIESTALAYTENDPATVITSALTVTDPDGNVTGATVSITQGFAAGEDVLDFVDQPSITHNYNATTGVLTLSGSASPAAYQSALRAVTYRNTSENPSGATRNITFQAHDSAAQSNTQSRDITVTPVNDAPVADDETFNGANSAVGNTTLNVNDPTDGRLATPDPTDTSPVTDRPHKEITGDILAGDTDADSPTSSFTVTPGTFATNDGGTVTIESDGDFNFEPAASTSCTDTSDFFAYTLNDNDPVDPRTDTGRVDITITGCVWYVNNDDAQGNSGTSEKPFDTLAQAETASAANQTIFVYDGDDTTTGYASGFNLKSGQSLIGEAANLVIGSGTLHGADATNKPTLTDNNADVVDLDDGTTVKGFNIDPQGTGGGIAGAAGDTGGGTIDDVNIVDGGTAGTQPGLELDSTTGTFNVSNLVVNNKATGVRLNNAGTVNFAPASQISITSAGAPGLVASGTSMGTSTFDDITVTNSSTGGVSLTNTTGTTNLGDGNGTDLDLTTSSGSTAAFAVDNGGTITVPSGGTANVSATGGPAVDVTNTSGASLSFDAVSSTNSANDGINLDGLGTGTFSATSGSITGAAGIAFDLNGGSGAITYPGALNNGSGSTADITGRSGGAVTLSGAIADTNDAGGGISLSGNTNGSTTFSNASKVLNTGGSDAVSFTGSDGHTLNLTGGGLDIDTTSGQGLTATTSGTLVVSGGSNTIDTTTGRALDVSATDFGATGATFQSISANGASNGIVLNNTGSAGSLTVTGSGSTAQGGDNSGGTIQSTTSFGISLTNTTGPSLKNMRILNTGDSGVNGTQVSGFSFTNGTITGAGDASDENSITFDDSLTSTPNLTGAVTVTDTVISQTEAEGVDIENWGGTISNANISGNALSDTGDVATPGSAVTLIASGLPASAASITRATIANNAITDFRAGAGVQVRADNPNAGGPAANAGVAGSATDVIAVTGNSMNGGSGGVGNQPDRFFTGGAQGSGQGNFNISNNGTAANRIRNIDCIAIELEADGPVTMTSTVQNNFINPNSAVGCAGIAVGTDDPSSLGAGSQTTLISGNNVMGTDGPGIFPIVRNSGSTMTARVINNTVAAPITTNAARAGIRVDSGSASGDTTLCLEISGNTTAGSTNSATSTTSPGINLRKQGTDPTVNTFGIEGLSPSPASSPAIENFVNSQNTSTSGTFGVAGTALLSATSGFTSCNAP